MSDTQNSIPSIEVAVQQPDAGPPARAVRPAPCAIVIFGATGDLTRRKLVPALYNLMADGALPDRLALVGVARDEISTDNLAARLRDGTAQFSRLKPPEPQIWARLAGSLAYLSGGFEDAGLYARLKETLIRIERESGTLGNRLFYLATPPAAFPVIIENLHQAGLLYPAGPAAQAPWSRVIVEKPFGRDLASARELNQLVAEHLGESQTLRIDHYLGKETVQNILVFRFGNAMFEPLWNRKYIDHVQITASETIGVEGRGRFYDSTGVLRDIIQNHLLQVLALCTMEAPLSFSADDVRDKKVEIFRSLRPIRVPDVPGNVVFGQYRGYRDEQGVSPDSRTPTYAAMKVMIDNWRWQGVPFYLRAGKHLSDRRTEIAIHLQPVPLCLFRDIRGCGELAPNVLTLHIQPREGISLGFVSKTPGDGLQVAGVRMNMTYSEAFGRPIAEAYERLLLDALRGDLTLFARRDGVEESWRFITPIIEAWEGNPAWAPAIYERATAGPEAAEALMARDGRRWEQARHA